MSICSCFSFHYCISNLKDLLLFEGNIIFISNRDSYKLFKVNDVITMTHTHTHTQKLSFYINKPFHFIGYRKVYIGPQISLHFITNLFNTISKKKMNSAITNNQHEINILTGKIFYKLTF